MFTTYFKQAWNLIRQEKLFSSIYIIGTGLSIAVVMVLSIVYYIKVADIYPETNRDRMLIVKSGEEKRPNDRGNSSSFLSETLINDCFSSLENAEAVSAVYFSFEENYVQPEGSKEQLPVTVKWVDTAFWKVFSFRFNAGQPFTEADMQSGLQTSVISASLARRLFGEEEAVGRYVSLDFQPYRVCGVVKDVSQATGNTYAQLWIPYTVTSNYNQTFGEIGALGFMQAYMLAPSAGQVETLRKEALESVRRYAGQFAPVELTLNGQPDKHWQSVFRFWSNGTIDFNKILLTYGLIFFVLLLVPAISLSGMTDSRMERRLVEMGIRRAFGAPKGRLMMQLMTENFLFTLLGGAFGLLLSYVLILLTSDWIMTIGQPLILTPAEGPAVAFSPTMLINIPVFLIALGICFVLNLLSVFIPAWRASRREIIYSLNLN